MHAGPGPPADRAVLARGCGTVEPRVQLGVPGAHGGGLVHVDDVDDGQGGVPRGRWGEGARCEREEGEGEKGEREERERGGT